MKYLILIKILKLINKLFPTKRLNNKINNSRLEVAKHFIFKLLDANKKIFYN